MRFEKEKILAYYKRLISLYPQEFREQFGESMGQTFNDMCNERKGNLSLTFLFSTFAETSAGVIGENLQEIKESNLTKHWLKNVGIAALFGMLILVSFLSLAIWQYTEIPTEELSIIPLLFMTWLLFTLIFVPVVSGLRAMKIKSLRDLLPILGSAVLFGLLLIAPLAVMVCLNNPRIPAGESQFPFLHFSEVWFLPTIFFLGATPIWQKFRAGASVLAHPIRLILRILFLFSLAIIWVNLLRHLMLCGGVAGCD